VDTSRANAEEIRGPQVGIDRAPYGAVMSFDRSASHLPFEEEVHVDDRPTVRPPPRRPSGMRRKVAPSRRLDPLEEALLARPIWDSRQPEPAIHEILYRLSVGDEAGAIAAAEVLLDGRRVPALTVSFDVLDEIELDGRAVELLAHVNGTTPLSRVLDDCRLERASAVRTLCELVERRIIVLRSR
jgi:hypothetical protein